MLVDFREVRTGNKGKRECLICIMKGNLIIHHHSWFSGTVDQVLSILFSGFASTSERVARESGRPGEDSVISPELHDESIAFSGAAVDTRWSHMQAEFRDDGCEC